MAFGNNENSSFANARIGKINIPVGSYLLKLTIETLEQGVK